MWIGNFFSLLAIPYCLFMLLQVVFFFPCAIGWLATALLAIVFFIAACCED